MANKVKAIPDGYYSVTPFLIVDGAAKAIEFYKKAFGAKERMKMERPDKKIVHAEITIGNSAVMLADANPEMNMKDPQSLKGSAVGLHIYVEDVDAFFDKAVKAGAKVIQLPKDQFYGDRSGMLLDPFGHQWSIATHKEDVSEQEMSKRFEAMMKGNHGSGCC